MATAAISQQDFQSRLNRFMEMQQYRTAYSPILGEPVEIYNIEMDESGDIYVNSKINDKLESFQQNELTQYGV